MFEVVETDENRQAVLKAIGIGGGGGNTLTHMLAQGHQNEELELIVVNTDQQALSQAGGNALPIGENLTKGLGAGAVPDIGRQAAEESEHAIRDRLAGSDMLFLTAGMGGGTGTGAAPVIARIARDMGILTVAIVTRPFGFEGPKRNRLAQEGIAALAEEVDSLITIPNDKLLPVLGKNATLLSAFESVNDVLRDAVLGISDMITTPGMINVDFADVRTVMSSQGYAKIGTATASGDDRAARAALEAIQSPLLDDIDVSGAKGLLVNITAGPDLSIGEFNAVGETLRQLVGDDATVVIGTSLDMDLSDVTKVSVVVTGLGLAPGAAKKMSKASNVSPGTDATAPKAAPYAIPRVPTTPEETTETPPEETAARPPAGVDQRISDAKRRYQEKPAATPKPETEKPADRMDEDYLDIPTFLRRPLNKK